MKSCLIVLILIFTLTIVAFSQVPDMGNQGNIYYLNLTEIPEDDEQRDLIDELDEKMHIESFLNPKFTLGTISNLKTGDTLLIAPLRLNLLTRQLEFKNNEGDTLYLNRLPETDVNIVHSKLIYIREFFGEFSSEGNYITLIKEYKNHYLGKLIEMTYIPEKPARHGYENDAPAKLKRSEYILLLEKSGLNSVELRNSPAVSKDFGKEIASKIKKYIKDNNIVFDSNYNGLSKVVEHYLSSARQEEN